MRMLVADTIPFCFGVVPDVFIVVCVSYAECDTDSVFPSVCMSHAGVLKRL